MSQSPLFSLHKSLVSIPCITGTEDPCSKFLASFLRDKGWTVELQNCADSGSPARENVYAYLGDKRNARLIMNSHLDVVPPYVEFREDEENVYGRGTADAKGCIAAQIMAVEELRAEGRIGADDVGLLYVVGEEADHIGMVKANDLNLSPEFLIVGEPTESLLARGHKGIIKFTLHSIGKAAHSGYPELGKSANEALIDVLYDLQAVALPVDPTLGPTTLNIGVISGGIAANIIPASATAEIMARVSTSVDEVWACIEEVLGRRDGIEVVRGTCSEPVKCDVIDGFETAVMKYNTDIAFLKGERKNYLYGPGSIQVAHVPHEFINKKELLAAVSGYKRLIESLLGV